MAFNQDKPVANGPLTSAEIRNNFQHLKNAIAKEHNWSDTDANVVTHKGGRQMFIANGTFIVPNGVTKVYVTLCGGGGGGGTGVQGASGGSGGGAGVRVSFPVPVVPQSDIEVIVGTAGIGGIGASNTAATAGGGSAFGTFVAVSGGGAGTGGVRYKSGSGGAAGGFFSTSGATGAIGTGTTIFNGVSGGETIFGIGGAAGAGSNGGGAGKGFGSGGGSGGGTNGSSVYRDGGNGAPGMVIVEWYN